MNMKRFLGFVPLLAVVAFVMIPAAAQAEPHQYKNGEITPPGEKVPQIAWGTLQLENINVGLIECKNIFAGTGQNPVGGGAAEGELEAYSTFGCKSVSCEAAGKAVEVFPLGLNNPKLGAWEIHTVENPAGTFKLKVGNKLAANAKQIKFKIVCTGVINVEFHGELFPNTKNGTSIGASPSKVEFKGATSGELESELGTGTVKGNLKQMGYEGQDLLTVKNP
jgi:hypothetical protein